MAENNAVVDFYETAPEDSEFISRIPAEIRFLRGAIRSAMGGEHAEIQTGNVVTGARHKMGAARIYVGTYGSTGAMTGLNPAGIDLSTSISTAATALADVGRMCVDVSDDYSLGIFANDVAAEGTSLWTYATVRGFKGTAYGPMYAASNSWRNLQVDNADWILGRNVADDDEVNIIKLNTADVPEIFVGAILSTSIDPVDDRGIAPKKYVDSIALTLDSYTAGAILGVVMPLVLTTNVSPDDDIASVQATTAGFLLCSIFCASGDSATVEIKTDSADPPTVVRGKLKIVFHDGTDHSGFICVPIKKDDYVRVVVTATGGASRTYNWIPLS